MTSVHFSTGLIDSAYAAGTASASTSAVDTMLANAELMRNGETPRSNSSE
jgi:hypothetical protein